MFKRKSLVLSRLNGLWCLLSAWQLYFFHGVAVLSFYLPGRGAQGVSLTASPSELPTSRASLHHERLQDGEALRKRRNYFRGYKMFANGDETAHALGR